MYTCNDVALLCVTEDGRANWQVYWPKVVIRHHVNGRCVLFFSRLVPLWPNYLHDETVNIEIEWRYCCHHHTHTWYSRTPWRELAIKSTHQTCFAYLCTNSTVRIYLAFTLNLSLVCSFVWPFVHSFLGKCVNPKCKFCDDKRPT